MGDADVLIVKGEEVRRVLSGRELDIIEIVQKAYVSHARGESSLPHSVFLRFPDDARNRIIGLPAYLGGEIDTAGIKWISSFPGNLEKGLDRASASIILNSAGTGRPEAIMEGSIISAKRTAASAVLGAKYLHEGRQANSVGLIGCGLINFEITRFLLAVFPNIERLVIFDLDRGRADGFGQMCQRVFGEINIEVVADINSVFGATSLVSFATTTIVPHISDVAALSPGSTILHISLRDLSPEVILACDNIVDDPDHVCRAQTSVHLTEQQTGNRDFIRCTLGDIITGAAAARKDDRSIAVFSPFGLGILDMAVACLVRDRGLREGLGLVIESFLPDSWTDAE